MPLDHPLTKRIETFTLGPGGTLPTTGAETKQVEIGDPLPETDEIRRIYLRVKNATFTNGGGATSFRFADISEMDAMWGALFQALDLEVDGCAKPIKNYGADELAQIYRSNAYESQVTQVLPPPGGALDLSATPGTFAVGDLFFEIPFVVDNVKALMDAAEVTEIVLAPKDPINIQCAQLCGLGHYRMMGQMQILENQAAFDAWYEEATAEEEFDED